jgi:hypothetical protein
MPFIFAPPPVSDLPRSHCFPIQFGDSPITQCRQNDHEKGKIADTDNQQAGTLGRQIDDPLDGHVRLPECGENDKKGVTKGNEPLKGI